MAMDSEFREAGQVGHICSFSQWDTDYASAGSHETPTTTSSNTATMKMNHLNKSIALIACVIVGLILVDRDRYSVFTWPETYCVHSLLLYEPGGHPGGRF